MAYLNDKYFKTEGLEIELGTGAGFFKKLKPKLLTTDIRIGPGIDMELDAQAMKLDDGSVKCIYAINVFHHLPEPDKFFAELVRVLQKGGGCILIEPHSGYCSELLHRYLHDNEFFDLNAKEWQTVEINGPLSGANQALAEIVFKRDLKKFEQRYGHSLEIIHKGFELNALRYFFSGGLNFRQFLPSVLAKPLQWTELICRPLARYWSLHQVIVIRKK